VAALAGEHFQTADLLRHIEVVRILIEYDPANINARDEDGSTPLFWVLKGRYFKDGSVLRLLLEHGADMNAQSLGDWIPLHLASFNGALEVVRFSNTVRI
jgi:ankyrin repeat protein